jgi:LuxR family transcriptional regulator, quorum-sensing system regulator CviR
MSLGKSLGKLLSKQDAIYLLELVYFSVHCEDKKDLIKLVNKLIYLMSYDFAICALGTINEKGLLQFYEVVNISYPKIWVNTYLDQKYYQVDPILKENFTKFNLQYWADTYKKIPPSKDLLFLKEKFGLKRGYSIGLRDLRWSGGSLFSVSGQYLEHHIRTETILTYTLPYFHQTLVRILDQDHVKRVPVLSSREIEILNRLKSGKTNWNISDILNISERTVKFHVKNIMKKLNATNRVHAVAIAIGQGLIEID